MSTKSIFSKGREVQKVPTDEVRKRILEEIKKRGLMKAMMKKTAFWIGFEKLAISEKYITSIANKAGFFGRKKAVKRIAESMKDKAFGVLGGSIAKAHGFPVPGHAIREKNMQTLAKSLHSLKPSHGIFKKGSFRHGGYALNLARESAKRTSPLVQRAATAATTAAKNTVARPQATFGNVAKRARNYVDL